MTPENLKPVLLQRLDDLRADLRVLHLRPGEAGRRDLVRYLDKQNQFLADLLELVLQHDASLFSIATGLDAVIDEKITITQVT